jgi:hypothetical protein
MWKGENKGTYMLPPGRLFHVGFPRRNLMIIKFRSQTDHVGYHPPFERVLYVWEPREVII